MTKILTIIRWLVGVLFIFSGLVKANDPLGLSYKMQEFFEVWGLHSFHSITLLLSIAMITFEIIAGVAVILGWKMRIFSWLLLLLILFFTFLTAYAVFSGKIKTCGCFGDCIPLKAMQSFWKDVVLTFLIGIIFLNRNRINSSSSKRFNLSVLLVSTGLTLGFQWYVLQYLPVMDCLPYKVGNNILEKRKIPPGAIPDSVEITFVYNLEGKTLEFSAEEFPEDFDERYIFVKRYDKVIRKGNAEPPIKDFSLTTLSGNDTTEMILQNAGYGLFFYLKEMKGDSNKWLDDFKQIQTTAQLRNLPLFVITSDASGVAAYFEQQKIPMPILLKCDAVAIKTASRSQPSLHLVKGGTIVQKWGKAALGSASESLKKLEGQIP